MMKETPYVFSTSPLFENILLPISIALFVVLVIVLHYFLVWKKTKDKLFWKRADYIWIAISAVAIILAVINSGITSRLYSVNKEIIHIEYSLQHISDYIANTISELCNPYYLREENIEEGDKLRDYCKYLSGLIVQVMRLHSSKNWPEKFSDTSEVEIASSTNKTNYRIIKTGQRINSLKIIYNTKIDDFNEAVGKLKLYEPWHVASNFWIFFLSTSIALRLTKVSGEIKIERGDKEVIVDSESKTMRGSNKSPKPVKNPRISKVKNSRKR